jgi:hypothetical protein
MFARLYDLGTLDMVSVRWGGVRNSVVWHRKPDILELAELLPLFITGLEEERVRL